MIKVYNRGEEQYVGANNIPIYRPHILGNPYTHIKDKTTLARFIVNNRDEAIKKYEEYFDIMYGSNIPFTKAVDELYSRYKAGEELYFECYCHPQPCHGDVIKRKLEQRLIKEKMQEMKHEKVVQREME